MNREYEIDYTTKTLPYLKWLAKRWKRLFGVTILSDRLLKAEYRRILAAIKEKKAQERERTSNPAQSEG